VVEWRDGGVRLFTITPEAVGLARSPLEALRGGGPEENAQALRELLDGKPGAYRDIVLLNTAAAFLVGGLTETLREGVERAAASIDEGRARAALDGLIAAGHG
jgi:anthranilate phosphoribosyltransferase